MKDVDHPTNFESMYESVKETVDDMSELKESIELELKNIKNDIRRIVDNYELRLSLLEKNVNRTQDFIKIGSGMTVGVLITLVLLFAIGLL